ncbi:DUF2807 domain-containing protein [Sphingomonas sp. 2R-10]|uniref:GIN domain-containing protein n=1 Tax=Sphingomonas sp. 2R-10 TaxID=3045148 RepID=UPI000F76C571|nr:DUF2807 domain-containing protein [Sphingomonas sp. 2R-10]MDJ0275265.1 DUF2807 domain-containing protein [Sphingomonas sp. 2R-10]
MKIPPPVILPALALIAATFASEERRYPVTSFRTVDVASADDVTIRRGPTASVVANGPPDILRDVNVAVRDDTLFIPRGAGAHRRGVRVAVTVPDLASVRAAGAGVVTVVVAKGQPFAGEMAGTGRLVVTGSERTDASSASRGDDARVPATGSDRVAITDGARCTVEGGATTRVTCG